MFVDTSALIAILVNEPEAGVLAAALERAQSRRTSPLVRLETCAVLATRLGIALAEAEALFEELIAEADIAIEPIDDVVGKLAVEAFGSFGKGRHPARLNIADCFSYAGAKARAEPLLFKGDDFTQTDVRSVHPAGLERQD